MHALLFLCLQVPYRMAHHFLPIAPPGILQILSVSDVILKDFYFTGMPAKEEPTSEEKGMETDQKASHLQGELCQ